MKKQINFMSIGDTAFFPSIECSVKQVNKIYPQAQFFIYDWGFDSKQVERLRSYNNVRIIEWKHRINYKNDFCSLKSEEDFKLKMDWKSFIRKYVLRDKEYLMSPRTKLGLYRQKEYLLCQKPYCMLDCAERIEGKLIFLDGDAFLINKIDEVLNDVFDIGVTLRPKEEMEKGRAKVNCNMLNSGVIFFNSNSEKIQMFIKTWIERMERTKEYMMEQTALTILIGETGKDIYDGYFKEGILKIRDCEIICKVLPCEKYNYNWIERGFDKEENKILHFKGERHSKDKFEKLVRKIVLGKI